MPRRSCDDRQPLYAEKAVGWKKKYREQQTCIIILLVLVVLLVLAAICDAVFIGIIFGKSNDIHKGARKHRFCIHARGFKAFPSGEDEAADPNGVAIGHLTVDEDQKLLKWKIKFLFIDQCGLSQWHIHGPFDGETKNSDVFLSVPSLPIEEENENSSAGTLKGELEVTDEELETLLSEPEEFYLNFHTEETELNEDEQCYPLGAVRDYLTKICPNPDFKFDDDDDDVVVDDDDDDEPPSETPSAEEPSSPSPSSEEEEDDDDPHKGPYKYRHRRRKHHGDENNANSLTILYPVIIGVLLMALF